ncbi:ChaC-like protein [Colletotrichum orchidophilum]|uniref:glutathione-specific gamma-glutamylcyclotransferase n=1 Tax=Colletotrichum orchidophilum TaxID=1209926 RepID=A0A1G4APT0_9PEZI|nr:ChaC-like protein [Colletotrichum orchidophilum]OHE91093.1 ChaC-like protein [Colletotrichum orchidophilum]
MPFVTQFSSSSPGTHVEQQQLGCHFSYPVSSPPSRGTSSQTDCKSTTTGMADSNLSTNGSGEFWLYGYGEDHRGTPEAPGRVVTLIERSFWEQLTDHHDSAPERVWGVAYRIKADKVAEVKDYLDIREINGYTIHYAPFYPADSSEPIRTLVYIGTPDNDQFVGPQDPQALAALIHKSRGPSGLNIDYLLGLEEALNGLSPESGDVHITDLSNRVRAIIAAAVISHDATSAQPHLSAVGGNFKQETSVKEQGETEKTD